MGEQSAGISLRILARAGVSLALAMLLANCAGSPGERLRNTTYSQKMVPDGEPIPRGGGSFKLGNPYVINGRTYVPTHDPGYRAEGIASWYGSDFHGRKTANGEVYDMHAISAAHPTMPLPSYARVTNLENNRSIIVRVNDRGPYAKNRIIDLSTGTAKALGTHGQGLARVRVEYVGRAKLSGSDDALLLASLRHGTPAPAPSAIRLAAGSARDPGVLPLPPERPFGLGDARPQAKPAPAKRARAPVTVLPEYAVADPVLRDPALRQNPGSAERAPALGLMSGRGLY